MKRYLLSLFLLFSIVSISLAQSLTPQPNNKGKWGYVNEKGKFVIKALYDEANAFSDGLACIKVNNQYGFINEAGLIVIPAIYESAKPFVNGYAKCVKDGLVGLISSTGNEYVPFEYSDLNLSSNKRYYVGSKPGSSDVFIISTGALPVISQFEEVSDSFMNGNASVKGGGLYGFMSENGLPVVKPSYLDKPVFSANGLAIVHSNSGYGLIDKTLKTIIPDRYVFVEKNPEGMYRYGNTSDNFGLVTADGNILVKEGDYSSITPSGNLYVATDKAGRKSVLDSKGKQLLKDCDNLTVADGIASFTKRNEKGKVDLNTGKRALELNGNVIWTPAPAKYIGMEDPFIVWEDTAGKLHWLNDKGAPMFEEYSKIFNIEKGYYAVVKSGKYAVAKASGQIISEWVDDIMKTVDGYVVLRKGDYGSFFRLSTGKQITDYDFSYVEKPLEGGVIPVTVRGTSHSISMRRNLKMAGDSFYIVGEHSEGFYPITDYNTQKMGVMKSDGTILVAPKYDEVMGYMNGMCLVRIVNKGYGFLNTSGALVIPCKYYHAYAFGEVGNVPPKYTAVMDSYGNEFFIDNKGNRISLEKIQQEAYNYQKQENKWY